MKELTCCICGQQFSAIRKDTKYCSKQCKNEEVRNRYNENLHDKKCVYCETTFRGKLHERLCHGCKGTRKMQFAKLVQEIRCRRCGDIVSTTIKNVTRTVLIRNDITCDRCKNAQHQQVSERMRENNPMHKETIRNRVSATIRSNWADPSYREAHIGVYIAAGERKRGKPCKMSEEAKEATKNRMLTNNPMHNPDIVEKMQKTRRENGHYDNYPNGKNHHLWKGNRNRSQTIRTRLYKSWVKPILIRDDFKCVECGASHCKLEVHHSATPFYKVVEDRLGSRVLGELNDDEFELLIAQVIDDHKEIDGMTLCVECHKKIDKLRR